MRWIRSLFGRKRASTTCTTDASTQEMAKEQPESPYLSDDPIASKTQDRFGRAPFAARIAETIAKRADPSSIVIGLFGPWGDGKTSVLKMMEESLGPHQNAIAIRFNPWHFPSEEALLRGFFATLAETLGKEPGFKGRAAELLEKYGGLLSAVSVALPGVEINPGEAAKNLGEALSKVGLDELKDEIDALLLESGKRLVILIDDIDRLDRNETHAIFKLVKLSASFKYTCYVLAFDDDVVSAALGERYGAGGAEAGRAFLEKIIQVPLHLPPADRLSLREITFEGLNRALQQANISIDQSQVDKFMRPFVDGLEPKLQTPRLAKQYINALLFSLPLVKGEVNIAEFMLIEGLRLLYPRLYIAIRDEPDMFLHGEPRDIVRNPLQAQPSPLDEVLAAAMPLSTAKERDIVRRRLLVPLFPRVDTMRYGPEWDKQWTAEQRLCSSRYFKRYFVYGVPEGDIADSGIDDLIASLATGDPEAQRATLNKYADRAMPRLIERLRDRAEDVDEIAALPLALAIVRNGDMLPRERGPYVMGGTFLQAAILVSQLMRQIEMGHRLDAVKAVIEAAQPLALGSECVRWLTHYPDKPEAHRVLPDDANDAVYELFAGRVRAASEEGPLFLAAAMDAPGLYWDWQKGRGKAEVEEHLRGIFEQDPASMDAFLDTYVGEGWEVASGMPVRSFLQRNSYDSIASCISPDYVMENLRERYGAELDSPEYHSDGSSARKVAHQFAAIHKAVLEQAAQPNGGEGA